MTSQLKYATLNKLTGCGIYSYVTALKELNCIS